MLDTIGAWSLLIFAFVISSAIYFGIYCLIIWVFKKVDFNLIEKVGPLFPSILLGGSLAPVYAPAGHFPFYLPIVLCAFPLGGQGYKDYDYQVSFITFLFAPLMIFLAYSILKRFSR